MNDFPPSPPEAKRSVQKLRDWLADHLGVDEERKQTIYLEIAQAVSMQNLGYWLQVLLAAGIATLGLVLNSPAVIIGAMLISPLMGGILANGLALATGDVVLAARAGLNVLASCLLAIVLAMVLVSCLPFKEATSEILARTQPNILDLVIALFSGAVGSIDSCRPVRGTINSIPGVAIAVALMPPLCVVGYGLGNALSTRSIAASLQIAQGGGLLFLTNLVAITFTAMIVFLLLHIDTDKVQKQVRIWRQTHPESVWIQGLLEKLPISRSLEKIGSLPSRFLLIVLTLLIISFPLAQSLQRLQQEITLKQQENQIRSTVTNLWQQNLATLPSGEPRSYIGNLSITTKKSLLTIQLQVITSQLYTSEEQTSYVQQLAKRLGRSPESIALRLVEIPTASENLRNTPPEEQPAPELPSIPELQATLLQEVNIVLQEVRLPKPAQLVNYEVITRPNSPLQVRIVYLSERAIDADGQTLLMESIQNRLLYPEAQVNFDRLDPQLATLTFAPQKSELSAAVRETLDQAGKTLQDQPSLSLDLVANLAPQETSPLATDRIQAVSTYLENNWQINPSRLSWQVKSQTPKTATIKLHLQVSPQEPRP